MWFVIKNVLSMTMNNLTININKTQNNIGIKKLDDLLVIIFIE